MQRQRVEATKQELEGVYRELQQNVEHLKKTERLTAAGQLSASLAHEIRNPLASISGAAGILSRGQASAHSQRECLDILSVESQRLNKLLTNFLHFARPRLPRMQLVEPADLLHSVATLAQHAAAERNVTLTLQVQPRCDGLHCDPEQIKQLLLNLLLNAVEASPGGSSVQIHGGRSGGRYRMEVRDDGEGISPQTAQHIFEPFFTTKANGTGLGLAIASTIAEQHNGVLTCVGNEERGTTFVLDLPCAAVSPDTEPVAAVRR
jgi:signal transduction histidine kinase